MATILAGLVFVIIGEAVRCWAAGHLKRKKELATSGPYAYVRDPLYFGRLFLLDRILHHGRALVLRAAGGGAGYLFLELYAEKIQKGNDLA